MTINTPYAHVIGDPISHSKSPLIHNFWIEKLGIDAKYSIQHIASDDLGEYFKTAQKDVNWRGCNITSPHKVASLDHVLDPGNVRETIGAINTVFRNENGEMVGTNTDAGGFYLPISNMPLKGAHVTIIGAGGAARAILFALKKAEIGSVTLLARNQLKAMGLLASFGIKGDVLAMDATLPESILLVNSSPLGMQGKGPLEIDLSPLPDDCLVYDIVYSPLKTQLMKAAKARNLQSIGGLDMLIGQAALAFELFFGEAPPEGHDDALRKLLTT